MADVYATAGLASETSGSDEEVLLVQQQKRSQFSVKRIVGGTAIGLALLAAIVYLTTSSGAAPQNGLQHSDVDVASTVQLEDDDEDEEVSTFYLIKHEFKSDDDVKPWWEGLQKMMADTEKFEAAVDAWHEAGYHNSYFMPTDQAGPIYCVWEAKAGLTEEDMTKFINGDSSPAGALKNTVMPYAAKLTGGTPTASYFAAQETKGGKGRLRRLTDDDSDKKDTFYVIKHEFKTDDEDEMKKWWGNLEAMMKDPKKFKAFQEGTIKKGFFNLMFFPTAYEGPFYCLWTAKAGHTTAEMEDFINTDKASPAAGFKNTVMPLPLALTGGPPGKTVDGKPNKFFKWD